MYTQFGTNPNQSEVKVIVADVACGLHRYLEERKHQNETFLRYSKLSFMLDTWHGDKVYLKLLHL